MRDPDNAVYDAACRALEAAQDLREEVRRPGAAAALAPLLGCVEVVLDELAQAHEHIRDRLTEPGDEHVRSALAWLTAQLGVAQLASATARSAAASAPASRAHGV